MSWPSKWGPTHSGWGTGSGFTPLALAGLALWLDAGTGVVSDGAAQFTVAQNQYLQLDTTPAAFRSDQGDFTAAAWIYADSITGVNQYFFSKMLSGGTGADWGLFVLTTGNVQFLMADTGGTNYSVSSSGSISAGTWYLAVGRYDSAAKTLSLSLNAVNQGTATIAGTVNSSTGRLRVGGRDNASLQSFGGRIDSPAFWSRRLTDAEVSTLYNLGNGYTYAALPGGLNSGLVSFWDLDERTGTRFDSKGSNSLTPYGDPLISPTVSNGGFETAGTPVTVVSGATNNGNFETGTLSPFAANTGAGTGTVTVVTGQSDTGTYAVQMVSDPTNVYTSLDYNGMVAGKQYTVTVRAKGAVGGELFSIRCNGVTVMSNATLTTSYQTFTATFTAQGTNLAFARGTQGATFYFDNVTVTDISDQFGSWSENRNVASMVTRDTSVFRSGSAAARFDVDGAGSNVNLQQAPGLIVGATYTVSFYARSNQASGGTLYARSGDYTQFYATSPTLNNSAWQLVTSTFVAKDTTLSLTPAGGSNSGFALYADDLTITSNGPTPAIGIAAGAATNNDPLKQWNDQSGNARNPSQATLYSKPTYLTNQIAGRPAVSFDGVDDQLALASYDYPADITYFAVVAQDSGSGGYVVGKIGGGNNASALAFSATVGFLVFGSDGASASGNDASPNGTTLGTFAIASAVVAGGAGTLEAFVNGSGNGSTAYTNVAAAARQIFVGSRGGNNYLAGRIAEIIVYGRALTTTERKQVEGYLSAKYGIAVT